MGPPLRWGRVVGDVDPSIIRRPLLRPKGESLEREQGEGGMGAVAKMPVGRYLGFVDKVGYSEPDAGIPPPL